MSEFDVTTAVPVVEGKETVIDDGFDVSSAIPVDTIEDLNLRAATNDVKTYSINATDNAIDGAMEGAKSAVSSIPAYGMTLGAIPEAKNIIEQGFSSDRNTAFKWFALGMPDDTEGIKKAETYKWTDLIRESPSYKEARDVVQNIGFMKMLPAGEIKETLTEYPVELIGDAVDFFTDPAALLTAEVIGQGFKKIPQGLDVLKTKYPDLYNILTTELTANKEKLANAYSTLDLHFGSTVNQIKKRHNNLSLKYHPDRVGGNATKFDEIQQAYDYIISSRESILSKIYGAYKQSRFADTRGFARIGRRTITGEIVARGGLDPVKLSKDYNIKELKEFGLSHILKKGGRSLDDMAQSLISEGIIQEGPGASPGDYLLELIKDKELRKISNEDALIKEYEKEMMSRESSNIPEDKDISFNTPELDAQIAKDYEKRIKELHKEASIRSVMKANSVKQVIEKMTGISDTVLPPPVRGGLASPILEFGKWKDRNALMLSINTLERNIEKVAGTDANKVKEFTTDKIKENETNRAEFVTLLRLDIVQKMNDLGIKYNSVEDKLVQRYGEGNISLDDLKLATPNWKEVEAAATYFRGLYDDLLNTINSQREQYNYAPIPKRKDYFRHYQELGRFIDFVGILKNENELPTEISGLTSMFKPGKPFSTVELQRMGGSFTESAIGGIDNYLDSASKQMFHIDSVQRIRALEKYIRLSGEEGKANLPNFVANLYEYGNLLAGKKASVDRAFESIAGRKVFDVVNALRHNTSINMIAANVSSALTNFIPFTQSLSTTSKTAAFRGMLESILSPFNTHEYEIDGVKSSLFSRRYPLTDISQTGWEKGIDASMWLFQSIDKFTTKSILAGKYYEGIEKGLTPKKAMKEADDYTARILADRAWGQLPTIFNAKTLAPFTQFQVEVNNMTSFIAHDIPEKNRGDAAKVASAFTQFVLYSYIFNNIFEKVTGRRPTIDPLYAILTLFGATQLGRGKTLGNRAWAAFSDLRENLPFGSVSGGRFPVLSGMPNIQEIMTGKKQLPQELAKTLFLVNPVGGGLQAKKTIEGLMDYAAGRTMTKNRKLKYRIDNGPGNFLRGLLFGKNAFPEAVKYRNTRGAKNR